MGASPGAAFGLPNGPLLPVSVAPKGPALGGDGAAKGLGPDSCWAKGCLTPFTSQTPNLRKRGTMGPGQNDRSCLLLWEAGVWLRSNSKAPTLKGGKEGSWTQTVTFALCAFGSQVHLCNAVASILTGLWLDPRKINVGEEESLPLAFKSVNFGEYPGRGVANKKTFALGGSIAGNPPSEWVVRNKQLPVCGS